MPDTAQAPQSLEAALASVPQQDLVDAAAPRGGAQAALIGAAVAQQPPVAAAPAPAAQEPPPPAPDAVIDPNDDNGMGWLDDMATEFAPGLAGKYKTPEEFFKGVANLSQQVGRLGQEKGQYEDIGRLLVNDPERALEVAKEYLPEQKRAALTAILSGTAPAAKPAAQDQPAANGEDAVLAEFDYLQRRRPEFKREWLKQRDKDGNFLPSVADKVQAWSEWKTEFDAFKEEHPDLEEKILARRMASSAPAPAPNGDLEQIKARQAQLEQLAAAQRVDAAVLGLIHRLHDSVPEDQRWMYQKGTNAHEYADKSKLTPHGEAFWSEMTRRMPIVSQNYTLEDAARDSLNRVREGLRQQSEQSQARHPAPKAGARTAAARPGEAAGSVHSPAKPGVRDFPAGKSLEEALKEAAQQDQSFRKKFHL